MDNYLYEYIKNTSQRAEKEVSTFWEESIIQNDNEKIVVRVHIMKQIESIQAAVRDLAVDVPGLDVPSGQHAHIKVTDHRLAMVLEPLNRKIIRPNPPQIFKTEVEKPDSNKRHPVPWISSHQKYYDKYYEPLDGPIIVSIVDYSSTAMDKDDRRKQDDKYAKRRQDELNDAGIPPECQIVYIMGDRVAETLVQKLAILKLSSEGWLVSEETDYSPQRYMTGAPDVVAWRSPLLTTLQENGLLQAGITLQELAYLSKEHQPLRRESQSRVPAKESKSLVAEVKGSNKSPGAYGDQLRKYLRSDFFDYGYGVIPGYRHWDPDRGLLTFDERGFEKFPDPIDQTDSGRNTRARSEEREWFIDHMDRVACQALLCNFDHDTIMELGSQLSDGPVRQPYDVVEGLWSAPREILVSEIIERLDRG